MYCYEYGPDYCGNGGHARGYGIGEGDCLGSTLYRWLFVGVEFELTFDFPRLDQVTGRLHVGRQPLARTRLG